MDDRNLAIEEYFFKNVSDLMDNHEQSFGTPFSEESLRKLIEIQADSVLSEVGVYLPGRAELIKRVKTKLEIEKSVTYGPPSILCDIYADHQEWLTEQYINEIKWPHWKSFRQYLRDNGAGRNQLQELNRSTTEILKNLENPLRPAPWDTRGLVVGNVQAGKTTNYIGVLAKAVDSGYKVLIVLAGTTNDLRSQTQRRIDDGLLGYDSSKQLNIAKPGSKRSSDGRKIHAATNSSLAGDYGKMSSVSNIRLDGEDAVLYVVKKNVSILRNLYRDLQNNIELNGRISAPMLLIDDEADNASVNGKQQPYDIYTGKLVAADETDPAKVNQYIRAILSCFSRSAYLAYTATPYANIFIMPSTSEDKDKAVYDDKLERNITIGEDLFPRNFIVQLSPGSNYYGPEKVFGLGPNDKELPIVIKTSRFEDENEILNTTKKTIKWIGVEMPSSMKYSILCFIISTAGKRFRNIKNKHNTMLIHVDRLTKVQNQVMEWVEDFVGDVKETFLVGTRTRQGKLLGELRSIWDEEYASKFDEIKKQTGDLSLTPISWNDIEPYLSGVVRDIECLEINSTRGKKGFEYDQFPEGRTLIAVGGDKLARGLTLEGLTVSYFLRHSRMYDSLLQMGRWFGYRNGYIDLSRIFASSTLISNFKRIASANSDLAEQFSQLASLQPVRSPRDFGLMVQADPSSQLMVTALNKSRNAIKRVLSFSGKPSAVTYITTDEAKNNANLEIIRSFVSGLGDCSKMKGSAYIWEGRSAADIINGFLSRNFYIDPHNSIYSMQSIIDYIKKMNERNEVVSWTVALFQGESDQEPCHLTENIDVILSKRTVSVEPDTTYYEINQRRLPSGNNEAIDLTKEEYGKAILLTNQWRRNNGKGDTDTPSPHNIRRVRPASKGLLMLYLLDINTEDNVSIPGIFPAFMLSFSESSSAINDTVVTYQLNAVAERDYIKRMEGVD